MSSGIAGLRLEIRRFLEFIKRDVWRINLKDLPKKKLFWVKQLRITLLAFKGFKEDDCIMRASALTFFSLLSIVPLVAVAFGLAKGFGLENALESQLRDNFSLHEDVLLQIIAFAHNMLENTRGGLLAGIGFAVLLFSAMRLLNFIELSFNKIWGIKRHRSFTRKFTDFLTILIIGPILVILSGSLTVYITTQIHFFTEQVDALSYFSEIIYFGVKLIPYVIMSLLLTLIYLIMPNTNVNFGSALVAGIIAGTIYQFIQRIYIISQVGVSSLGAIYGSFAAIPLFFIWIQLSWLIILFGAEIAYAHQAVDHFEYEDFATNISTHSRILLALLVMKRIIKNFEAGEEPLSLAQISHDLKIPIRICTRILQDLVDARLASEVNLLNDKDIGYQPARDTHAIDVYFVIDSLERLGETDLNFTHEQEFRHIENKMHAVQEVIRQSEANILVRDL